ncbi:divalent metal cation transporter [Verrucomicrobiales bacterium]|nr:divalent metal cation transporter [Verrucomicrobiales bacterium]
MKRLLNSIGPAIIVAAIVLGPGSILTSSKVGALYGYPALGIVALSTVLLIGMVALAARIGVIYEDSPCDQIASRLGRPVAVAVGLIVFGLVAIFQFSNNVAIVSGLAPLFESADGSAPWISKGSGVTLVLLGFNAFVIFCLYRLRHLYSSIEKIMKVLVGLMVVAFLINFAVVLFSPRGYVPVSQEGSRELMPLLGLMATTFSVAGAFYQAYLVKEKGWTLTDARRGVFDSVMSISILGLVTAVILITATRVFHGRPEPVALLGVGDVARQLQPLFGSWAKVIFCVGILAGATSSFLVNALVGGTVLSDALGKGSRLQSPWLLGLTTLALLSGMLIALFNLQDAKIGSVTLITVAQALTVIGLPALALSLIYLGTRPELTGNRRVPPWIIILAIAGFIVACVLAVRMILLLAAR